MFKKAIIAFLIIALQITAFLGISTANQNHGQKVSEIAKSTEPGPLHGATVSHTARNKSQNTHAVSLDGQDDYITIPHRDNQNLSSDFAIEFWVKSSGSTDSWLISKHAYYWGANGWIIQLQPDGKIYGAFGFNFDRQVYWRTGGTAWRGVTSNNQINDNKWHHIALVLNEDVNLADNIISLYVDGKLNQTLNYRANIEHHENFGEYDPWFIGPNTAIGYWYEVDHADNIIGPLNYYPKTVNIGAADRINAGFEKEWLGFLNASIDEVRIWNKFLTQEEVLVNMNKEIDPQEGLVGYWKLNEDSGDIANDSSGNENHAYLRNGPSRTTDSPF